MISPSVPVARARRLAVAFALVGIAALAQGCVSTEELYAEYDARACRVAVETTSEGTTRLREIATERTMIWEPMINFELNDAAVTAAAARRLDRDVAALRAFPELRVLVRGFTDASGTPEHNLALAKRRVAEVVAYLRARGIDGVRVYEAPFGESMPLVAVEGRMPINRRVELTLTDADGRPVPLSVRPLEAGEADAADGARGTHAATAADGSKDAGGAGGADIASGSEEPDAARGARDAAGSGAER